MLEYINYNYSPTKKDLVVEYYVEPNNISLEEAAEHLAAESSIGTWTDIWTMDRFTAKHLKPSVFEINKKTNEIKIAYNADLFENNNIPQVLSSVAGNIFGMSAVNKLRLQDIHFPKCMVEHFKGPQYGIDGIRKLLNIKKRPLIGTIIKPKIGLGPEKHAQVAYEAWTGGIDIVKDDENLTNQNFNPFKQRVVETLEKLDKAEKITGEKKVYMPNVTAEVNEMIRRAEFVKDNGGTYIMVDIMTVGFSALQTLRDQNFKLVLHGHRAMHAAVTRDPHHGISMLTIAKLCRLIGLDQLHVGAVYGKMHGSASEVSDITYEIEESIISENKKSHLLEQKWYGLKPMFAVCSGGLHPGKIQKLINTLGNNIIIQAGGGVHGHPFGTRKGAMAMRQAVEATMRGIDLRTYAKTHSELGKAIEKWGI